MNWFRVKREELREAKEEVSSQRIKKDAAIRKYQKARNDIIIVKEEVCDLERQVNEWKAKVREQTEADLLATSIQIISDIVIKNKKQADIEPSVRRQIALQQQGREAMTPLYSAQGSGI